MALDITRFGDGEQIVSTVVNRPINQIVQYINLSPLGVSLSVTQYNVGDDLSASVMNQPLIEIRDFLNGLVDCIGSLTLDLYVDGEDITAANLNRPIDQIVDYINNSCNFGGEDGEVLTINGHSDYTPNLSIRTIGVGGSYSKNNFFVMASGHSEFMGNTDVPLRILKTQLNNPRFIQSDLTWYGDYNTIDPIFIGSDYISPGEWRSYSRSRYIFENVNGSMQFRGILLPFISPPYVEKEVKVKGTIGSSDGSGSNCLSVAGQGYPFDYIAFLNRGSTYDIISPPFRTMDTDEDHLYVGASTLRVSETDPSWVIKEKYAVIKMTDTGEIEWIKELWDAGSVTNIYSDTGDVSVPNTENYTHYFSAYSFDNVAISVSEHSSKYIGVSTPEGMAILHKANGDILWDDYENLIDPVTELNATPREERRYNSVTSISFFESGTDTFFCANGFTVYDERGTIVASANILEDAYIWNIYKGDFQLLRYNNEFYVATVVRRLSGTLMSYTVHNQSGKAISGTTLYYGIRDFLKDPTMLSSQDISTGREGLDEQLRYIAIDPDNWVTYIYYSYTYKPSGSYGVYYRDAIVTLDTFSGVITNVKFVNLNWPESRASELTSALDEGTRSYPDYTKATTKYYAFADDVGINFSGSDGFGSWIR